MDGAVSFLGGTGDDAMGHAHGMGDGHGMGEMHEMMTGGGMGGMMGTGMAISMLLWTLVGLALLVLAVVAIVWLVRRTRPDSGTGRDDGAEGLLRRRYAAGEIDDDEFHRRLAILSDRRS